MTSTCTVAGGGVRCGHPYWGHTDHFCLDCIRESIGWGSGEFTFALHVYEPGIVCPAGCKDGFRDDESTCEQCGGHGYLVMVPVRREG